MKVIFARLLQSSLLLLAGVSGVTIVVSGQVPEWQDPTVFERGQTPPHATLMPFETLQSALDQERLESRFCTLLNGTWKFHWAPTPSEAPEFFYQADYDVEKWSEIEVPGNWQMQGYGHPLFRNVNQPFPSTPPYPPASYNPVGSYRRTFLWPAPETERQVFLRFEGVKSASYVWLNGVEVGYNEGGMEPAEYDVTELLRVGENTLAVQVLRFADSTYLEDQDMWRLSGIFRDVYLMATPKVHLRDFFVTTNLDPAYRNADLRVTAELRNYSGVPEVRRLQVRLFDPFGDEVSTPDWISPPVEVAPCESRQVTFSREVEAPRLWSAEKPWLYTLALEHLAGEEITEVIPQRVGFREVEVRNRQFWINGVAVKLNSVNSHIHHPRTGRTMDRATMREDLILMKRFNLNSVRTSHYPPDPDYLALADELGLYVIDETNDEAHSTTFLSERPEWRAMYLDRVRKMVVRDRNHPSVVIWSAGNESGSGSNICAVIAEGKRLDPSRPAWLYGGNNDYFPSSRPLDCEDIVGPRYPTPFELLTRIALQDDPRPSFMDEYAAATGNSLGSMDEFWEVIWSHPRTIGGAVWDWVSPGIEWDWITTPDDSPKQVMAALMGRAHLVEGRSGRALALSGHDEWVEVYRDPALDLTGRELTLEIDVLPGPWNGTGPLLTKGNHQYGVQQVAADQLEFYIYDGWRVTLVAPTPPDWEGRWHHLAAIYDGRLMRLFIDGEVVGSLAHQGAVESGPFPVNIGRNAELHGQEHPGELLKARVDRVRIFPRALSLEEIRARRNLRREAVLWLDFETTRVEQPFYSLGIGGRSYGLVWPDRTPQPELWQLKKSAQPVQIEAVDLEKPALSIRNRFAFTDLRDLNASWQLMEDGDTIQSGSLEIEISPGAERTVEIPLDRFSPRPGALYRMLVTFSLKESEAWAEVGHTVAWEQFLMPVFEQPPLPERLVSGELEILEEEERLVIRGADFRYAFDRAGGRLASAHFRERELLREGGGANFWRAPLANELDAWAQGRARVTNRREGMGENVANGWRSIGLDRLEHHVDRFTIRRLTSGAVEVSIETHATSSIVPEEAPATGFEIRYRYRIAPDGAMTLDTHIVAAGVMPDWLPKIGVQFILPSDLNRLTWYGRGPVESYPDRKTGAQIGIYQGTVEEQYVPYLIPQDHGNKSDVLWATLTDESGVGWFLRGAEALNMSVQKFATENLTRALYPPQLQDFDGITLNLDHRVTGVGGTAISVLNPYRVYPGEYRFQVKMIPFDASLRDATELGREKWVD